MTDLAVVTERTLRVSLTLELSGEFMTQDELEAVVDDAASASAIVCAVEDQVARAFKRSVTVGWTPDQNRSVELVGVSECLATGPVQGGGNDS